MDSFELSLFEEVDAFYTFGHDATMDDAYKDELAIVPYVKHEIFAIAPYKNTSLHVESFEVVLDPHYYACHFVLL